MAFDRRNAGMNSIQDQHTLVKSQSVFQPVYGYELLKFQFQKGLGIPGINMVIARLCPC